MQFKDDWTDAESYDMADPTPESFRKRLYSAYAMTAKE